MERHTLWVSLLIFNTPLLAGKDFLTNDTLLTKPILCMENSVARVFKSHAYSSSQFKGILMSSNSVRLANVMYLRM